MVGCLSQVVCLGFMEIFLSKLELMGLSGGEESDKLCWFEGESQTHNLYRKSVVLCDNFNGQMNFLS